MSIEDFKGKVAVITGAGSGFGREFARLGAELDMALVLADVQTDALQAIRDELEANGTRVLARVLDVADGSQVDALAEAADAEFGDVHLLFNNAGVGTAGLIWENSVADWQWTLGVNLWGVINGVHAFAPAMIAQGKPGAIINTGSKQGITCPPGDTAYNVSKAGVKVVTEGLAHALRNTPDCQVTAHLLVPGWTFTPLTANGRPDKPAGAWTADQVVDFMLQGLGDGDFYIICPDNDVTREVDNKRIQWAANDIVENRPPLSRWHPEYEAAFADFLRE